MAKKSISEIVKTVLEVQTGVPASEIQDTDTLESLGVGVLEKGVVVCMLMDLIGLKRTLQETLEQCDLETVKDLMDLSVSV